MKDLKKINTTLLLIVKNKKVLLAEKKRGFGQGKFNGIGGKQDLNETIEQAMIRETQEEINVTPVSYSQVGKINYDVWYKGKRSDLCMNIFICTEYVGEIMETEEMRPQWFDLDKIPYDRMFDTDKIWFKDVIAGKKVYGAVQYDQNGDTVSEDLQMVQ